VPIGTENSILRSKGYLFWGDVPLQRLVFVAVDASAAPRNPPAAAESSLIAPPAIRGHSEFESEARPFSQQNTSGQSTVRIFADNSRYDRCGLFPQVSLQFIDMIGLFSCLTPPNCTVLLMAGSRPWCGCDTVGYWRSWGFWFLVFFFSCTCFALEVLVARELSMGVPRAHPAEV
jgi:hypothetical protein